jgi:hypothetical protein
MGIGENAKFHEVNEFLEYAVVAGIWSGTDFSDPATLDYYDVSKCHRLVALILFGDVALIDPIYIGIVQATDADGTDAKPLWMSAELDGADFAEGDVGLIDLNLQGRIDSQNGFRYVGIGGMGQAPPIGWILLGSGPRYKPPRYHEEFHAWAELAEGELAFPEGGGGV